MAFSPVSMYSTDMSKNLDIGTIRSTDGFDPRFLHADTVCSFVPIARAKSFCFTLFESIKFMIRSATVTIFTPFFCANNQNTQMLIIPIDKYTIVDYNIGITAD